MAHTEQTFRDRFPEFRTASSAIVNAALIAALAETSSDWGDAFNEAQGLLAAHKLATSPSGNNARVENAEGKSSSYLKERDEMGRRLLPAWVAT